MEPETSFIIYKGVVVPESVLVKRERTDRYGSVPDLEDEEPAEPEELERCVLREEWGPVLALPKRERGRGIRAAVDEDGDVDWGAFGTVDFDKRRPKRDRDRSKAEELREKLKNVLIMLSIVRDRLPGKAARQVVKWLGVLEVEHIVNDDMRALARLCMRANKLRQRIAGFEERSREREQRALEAWLEALG